MIPYKGMTFGGWIAENFVTFSRIFPWFYSHLMFVGQDPEEPQGYTYKPISKWNTKEARHWLLIHGLDHKGRLKELKEKVKASIDKQNLSLPSDNIWWPPGGKLESVLSMVESTYVVICALMSVKPPKKDVKRLMFW